MKKTIVQKYLVTKIDQDRRTDLVLTKKMAISRSQAQNMIVKNQILVNKKAVTPKNLVKVGDKIEVLSFGDRKMKPPKVVTIFEDENILVLDKPTGISTHPASGEKNITLSEIFVGKLKFIEQKYNSGVVHRLDKGTSGVIVLAKNLKTQEKIQKQFKARQVKKKYITLVSGELIPQEGVIEIALNRDYSRRGKITVGKKGKPSTTRYKVIKRYQGYSLLEIFPETGRTHQIRVHLSALGYPIVGDVRYGQKSLLTERIFLHASEINFVNPTTQKRESYRSNLPIDLKKFLEKISLD